MNENIGIIIINYNGNEDTIECLRSIEKFYQNKAIKIFLVDNNSSIKIDLETIDSFNLDIIYLPQNKNLGFAEGNNIGIRKALEENCNFILLLNNDTLFIDDSLNSVIDLLKRNQEIGICGLVNYYYDDSSKIWQAGAFIDFKLGRFIHVNEFDKDSHFPLYVDYIPGSSLCFNTKIINTIGLLDANYFAYFEESDYCINAKKNGYRVVFLPNSRILHKIGKSSDSQFKFYLRLRNKLYFFNKYSEKKWFIFIYIYSIMHSLKISIKKYKSFRYLKICCKAIFDFHFKKYEIKAK